ncbi:MAG: hypothetical protein LBF25_03025 [Puniceicoccales bacterium]|nr:hypothetical protein [Puniceicoccales bacterium]
MAILTTPDSDVDEIKRRVVIFDERRKIKKPSWVPGSVLAITDPALMLFVPI